MKMLNKLKWYVLTGKKQLFFLVLLTATVNNIYSSDLEDGSLKTINTNMIAFGSANLFDTYLSPLEYKGFNIKFMNEQMRDTRWFNNNFKKQQNIVVEIAKANNPHGNASFYWLKLQYQLGGHYFIGSFSKLKVNLGGLADINLEGLYSDRNGNNPATARAYANLTPSILLSYLVNTTIATRLQFDLPLLGVYFQPQYGESYYELSLGNRKDILNLTSIHNQRAARLLFTTDFTCKTYSFRLGILSEWYQSRIHSIHTHNYSTSIILGIPIQGYKKSKKEKTQNTYWE